jgi:uncharacterized protein YukJ
VTQNVDCNSENVSSINSTVHNVFIAHKPHVNAGNADQEVMNENSVYIHGYIMILH